MKKLSVIIPVYNTPQPLWEHCIASVQENICNMGDEVEVFLINDGSTDPHVEPMLKAAEAVDSRLKYILKSNSGVSDTRNKGIEMAQGEYITFVDSDDYLEPDAFVYMVNSMDGTNADMGVFGYCGNHSQIKCESYKRIVVGNSKRNILNKIISFKSIDNYRERSINLYAPWGKIFKKKIIDKYHLLFDTHLVVSEDAFFNFTYMTFAEDVYFDNKLTYHYIANRESVTKQCSDKFCTNLPILLSTWDNFLCKYFAKEDEDVRHALSLRTLSEIKAAKNSYFTHPENSKSFLKLYSEMNTFLQQPIIKRQIKELKITNAENIIALKNIILLKMHLYWIFLITERRKRKFYDT